MQVDGYHDASGVDILDGTFCRGWLPDKVDGNAVLVTVQGRSRADVVVA
jgi:hypothetical protein